MTHATVPCPGKKRCALSTGKQAALSCTCAVVQCRFTSTGKQTALSYTCVVVQCRFTSTGKQAALSYTCVVVQCRFTSRGALYGPFGTSTSSFTQLVNMVLNVHRNHKVYQGRGEGRRGGVGGGRGRGRLYTCRYTVTIRMTPALRWAAMRAIHF